MSLDDATSEHDWDRNRLSDAECEQVFDRLFPGGFSGPDVLGEIAPEGWEKSSLVRVFHPTDQGGQHKRPPPFNRISYGRTLSASISAW
jgi:hypothetical protein